MKKINKTVARRLYNEGASVYLMPCKMRPVNIWRSPMECNIARDGEFDALVNRFEYYNCNNECGYRAAYYVEG